MELTEDQLEPNYITLKEEENEELEIVLRRVSGRNLEMPGKEAIKTLPQKEPKPPLVETVNIVVKHLDPVKFPILSNYTNQMLQDLQRDKILDDVIGINRKGKVREFDLGKMKVVGKKIGSYNVVPKESYMYVLTLPDYHFLMLRHLGGRWFRALAYLSDHESYSEFLNIFFTNKTKP
ncbi:hypothetical protein RhiirA5_505636 [Rhizophagus irregularis]|uniref:Uncharacterized protein n=1 Tax=Rhizophagus irregularis TaxID=588596 RepID=A0A2N0QU21_9GLOM|nr:hypothetical protein RhiirA5_505636 [Rhizophagus irregularis]PKC54562.1 hypothetical protein RhiirA1_542841 [Rhizophagus irregularis]